MCDTYAILALRRKRAYLAGEIAQAERQLADKHTWVKNLDATIQLFQPTTNPDLIPAIRPTRRGLFFRQGEQMRLCRDALREAWGSAVGSAGRLVFREGEGTAGGECADLSLDRGAGAGGVGPA
jgi:hypothetical protein